MSLNNGELNTTEERNLVIQAGIKAIPYVGSSISTLVFGRKQELRLKRLETFFKEIIPEIKAIKSKIAQMEKHDEEAFLAIFEELTEKIEREQFMEKQNFFKIYFKNTLINPVDRSNYDERRFFLDTLGSISPLQIQILGILYKEDVWRNIGDIQIKGANVHMIAVAAIRLASLGLLMSRGASAGYGNMREPINQAVKMTSCGRRFCEFCLNET